QAQVLHQILQGTGAVGGILQNVVGISPIAQNFATFQPDGSVITTQRGIPATGSTLGPATFNPTTGVVTFPNVTNGLQPTQLLGGGFPGILGAILPGTAPAIAGVNANSSAMSGFNFLTLSKAAGGRANIATMPA